MNTIMRSIICALFAASTLGLVAFAQADPPARQVTLAGQVIDASTGEPVVGATVVLQDHSRAAITNDEGNFLFWAELPATAELPGGTLDIAISHVCYFTTRVEARVPRQGQVGRVDVGLPYDFDRYGGDAPPLGGCELR